MKSKLKRIVIGEKRDPRDPGVYHKIALMAFFAWIGLGSDGLSSSCYGPAEAVLALRGNMPLSLLIACGTVITIFIISSSYSQIIELFPSGGGGYLVASKLLSPRTGMVSGCALLIDYVLTITVSLASGTDALFSFLPLELQQFKLPFALAAVILLAVLNLRGVKESVVFLMPIFLIFVATHLFVIAYAFFTHFNYLPEIVSKVAIDYRQTQSHLGTLGVFLLLMHAYSMGAGTYTGIEAVSNGLPILREPRVKTAKTTMRYMAISLSVTVFGLILAYLFFNVTNQPGKTLNARLFELATASWSPTSSYLFVIITLISEAAILFVAAQTGFLDGPRVLSNMAHDRWVPTRFSALSDRLVTQNGVMLMSGAAFVLMLATRGSVVFLLVLYSINVFLTFVLSQLGMVKHWIQERKKGEKWRKGFIVNGLGLMLCFFILVMVVVTKFHEGGWITILITGSLVSLVLIIRKHYDDTGKMLGKLDQTLSDLNSKDIKFVEYKNGECKCDTSGRTAVLLVNGFSGIGLHSLLSIFKLFGSSFSNFVFVQIGLIDAGVFKGIEEVRALKEKSDEDVSKYVGFINDHGFYAEGITSTGLDVVEEIMKLASQITEKYPRAVFFGGQIVFPKDTFFTRLLHNYTVFSVQRRLYKKGIEFVILPISLRKAAA